MILHSMQFPNNRITSQYSNVHNYSLRCIKLIFKPLYRQK